MNRRHTLAAGALAGLLFIAGCGSTAPESGRAPTPAPSAPTQVVPVATAITIPAIEAHSSLVPVGLTPQGALAVPSVHEPGQAAYFDGGPMPGQPGPALVVGHVNGDGLDGVFVALHRLKPGDEVRIDRKDAPQANFRVTKVEKVSKQAFPWDRVLADTAAPELRLVTCGGAFDRARRSYEDNWIVWAVAA